MTNTGCSPYEDQQREKSADVEPFADFLLSLTYSAFGKVQINLAFLSLFCKFASSLIRNHEATTNIIWHHIRLPAGMVCYDRRGDHGQRHTQ